MLPLADLQSAMRDAALGGDMDRLSGLIVEDGFSHTERLSIHRSNTTILLTEALAATFKVVHKLVGEDFFEAVARLYVRAHPPQNPCLFEYGHDFPAYLANLPQLAELPYVADVARLEWAWNEAFHAAEAPVLSASDLAAVDVEDYGQLTFIPHPTLRFVASPYPIKEIWAVNQCGADDDATVDLDEGAQALAVVRPRAQVEFLELSKPGLALSEYLNAGALLGNAVERVQAASPDFDPAPTLAILIGGGAFSAHILES